MIIDSLGGHILGTVPLGDIVFYINPFHLFMFVVIILFTVLIALSRPETQVEASFGKLEDTKVGVGLSEFKQRRFLAIICGIATAGAMITGDLYNFTLFMSLVGIVNIGIVSAVKQVDVLDAAYQYGLIAMMCSLPLFGGACIVLASTGTLSLIEIAKMTYTTPMMMFGAILLFIGICGETGIAPFFATKAEMFRTPGSPFILIIHLSSLFIMIRAIEILLIIIKVI
ncbi:MAG: hypothetical protein K1X33_04505 [Methanobacteriaceae archaeon]|nr:hypothetical protein [Methanobacteriaceae archaeon]